MWHGGSKQLDPHVIVHIYQQCHGTLRPGVHHQIALEGYLAELYNKQVFLRPGRWLCSWGKS